MSQKIDANWVLRVSQFQYPNTNQKDWKIEMVLKEEN